MDIDVNCIQLSFKRLLRSQNLLINIAGIIILAMLSFLYFIFHTSYVFSFNFSFAVTPHYYIFAFAFLIFTLAGIVFIMKHKTININYLDIIVLLVLLVFLSLLLAVNPLFNIHKETFCMGGVFLLVYLFFRFLPINLIKTYFVPILLLMFFSQLFMGFKQLYNLHNTTAIHLHLNGSLLNSGVYSIYLAIHIPLLIYYIKKNGLTVFRRLVIIFIIAAVLVLIYFTESRTAIIVLVSITFIYLLPIVSSYLHRYRLHLFFACFFLLILGSYFLFSLKPLSALGRLLIWKISLIHSKEYLLTGIGYGEFYRNYPLWQIEYFQNISNVNVKEILVADESFIAFNEPLQWFVETGIIGFLAVAIILFFIFRKSFQSDEFCKTLRITVAMIIISSLFSYSLHVNSIAFLFILCIAVLSPNVFQNKITVPTKYLLPFFTLNCFLIIQISNQLKNVLEWDKLSKDVLLSEKQLSDKYQKVLPSLKQSGKFMLDFSQVLFLSNDKHAMTTIEKATANFPSVASFYVESQIFEMQNDYKRSIESYKQLCGIQPHKFSHREKLMKLYIMINDTANANREAELILSMPIKIPSSQIDSIRGRAREYLTRTSRIN